MDNPKVKIEIEKLTIHAELTAFNEVLNFLSNEFKKNKEEGRQLQFDGLSSLAKSSELLGQAKAVRKTMEFVKAKLEAAVVKYKILESLEK